MPDQSDYWSKKHARRVAKNSFADLCSTNLSGSETLLDLGCGRGEDLLHFATIGCDVTGLDISPSNLEQLRQKADKNHLTIDLIEHDLSKPLPFENESFDVVYAHLSVHYFDDRTTKEIFSEIERVLKPQGWLFVKCKSIDDPLYGKGKKVGPDMFEQEHVRHFFSENYMRECLGHFSIVEVTQSHAMYVDYESAFIEAVARKL